MSLSIARTSAAALVLTGVLGGCTGGIQAIGAGGEIEAGFTVGGTVSGLTGQGLTLQNNGGATLGVTANGSFTFNALLLPGDSYDVVVSVQPTSPTQTCAVTHGTGTVSASSINNIVVVCAAKTGALDTIGGTVSGDLGTGLVLQNNGGDNITVTNGAFTFPTALPSGFPYDVTVLSPPIDPYQNCTVTNASGTTGATDVNDVSVTCVTNSNPTFTIGGTITGLTKSKGTIVLQDNGRDDLTLSKDGAFTFALPIPSGSFYDVTSSSLTGPVSLTCSFSNASGLVGNADVTDIAIACVPESSTPLTPVTVNVSGLVGSDLVLQDNGTDSLPISQNGSFGFAVALPSGTGYDVTVLTQPSNPTQICTVTNGSGTVSAGVPITVTVTCQNAYTIGGTVQGYSTGTGLSIADNGGTPLALTANGAFTFPTPLPTGATYKVTIVTQPTGPPSAPVPTCVVQNASGTVASANVTSVLVSCSVGSGLPKGEWIWQSGSNAQDAVGVYGTLGTAAAGNVPGARTGAMSFTQGANLWLFGGDVSSGGPINDLWEYSTATGLWTWQAGSSSPMSLGNYGTLGVPAASNEPPARQQGVSWSFGVDFYLFGGNAYIGLLSDLWTYDTSTGDWTWIAGPSSANQKGVYGTQDTGAPTNVPGARDGAISWASSSGVLWLFGGQGYDSQGTFGDLNDLWFYSSDAGEWVWVSGSNLGNALPSYGTLGTPGAENVPGARTEAVSWIDANGNLWLFGGQGYDSQGNTGPLNDLWEFNTTTNLWTWMSGSTLEGAVGVYGTQGTPAATNVPGARQNALSWVDAAGNLWLFGGYSTFDEDFNDLWEYAPSTGLWTWVSGSKVQTQPGVYGTLGVAAPTNIPGARDSSVSWVDASGNFWLFGGEGYISSNPDYPGALNDLWEYVPP